VSFESSVALARRFVRRINQLGGKPNLNPDGVISRAASEYVEGENLVDMIKENLVAERIAIETYRDMVRHFGNKDVTTRVLLERILAQEEEHANDMHDLLVTHEGRPMLEKVECRPRMRSESWRKFVGRKAYCGTGTWELTDHQNIGGLPSPRLMLARHSIHAMSRMERYSVS
jgi:hypothetical protein